MNVAGEIMMTYCANIVRVHSKGASNLLITSSVTNSLQCCKKLSMAEIYK